MVRPTIELVNAGNFAEMTLVDYGIGHLLQALLSNAADASQAVGTRGVNLHLEINTREIKGEVRDYGAGFSGSKAARGTLFGSSKSDGLGLELVLSRATVERLGWKLIILPDPVCGMHIQFYIALVVENSL